MKANGDPDVRSNAGRCDICGSPIDMEHAGDTLTIQEFGIESENLKDTYDFTDQDAADSVAAALEAIADSVEDRELARIIREERAFRVHGSCLSETNFSQLETEVP